MAGLSVGPGDRQRTGTAAAVDEAEDEQPGGEGPGEGKRCHEPPPRGGAPHGNLPAVPRLPLPRSLDSPVRSTSSSMTSTSASALRRPCWVSRRPRTYRRTNWLPAFERSSAPWESAVGRGPSMLAGLSPGSCSRPSRPRSAETRRSSRWPGTKGWIGEAEADELVELVVTRPQRGRETRPGLTAVQKLARNLNPATRAPITGTGARPDRPGEAAEALRRWRG